MAQEPAKAAPATDKAEGAEAPKPKKKLIIILAAVLVLLIGGGATGYFMMQKKPDAHQAKAKGAEHEAEASEGEGHGDEAAAEEAESEAEGHADPKTALTFVPFETFTVNLLPDPDDKFLQLDLTAEVKGAELAEKILSLIHI